MKMSFSKNNSLNYRDKERTDLVIAVADVVDSKADHKSNKEVTNL
jgi:hypothetical protein